MRSTISSSYPWPDLSSRSVFIYIPLLSLLFSAQFSIPFIKKIFSIPFLSFSESHTTTNKCTHTFTWILLPPWDGEKNMIRKESISRGSAVGFKRETVAAGIRFVVWKLKDQKDSIVSCRASSSKSQKLIWKLTECRAITFLKTHLMVIRETVVLMKWCRREIWQTEGYKQ